MDYFEKSVLIDSPLNKVFEFHSDTNNLKVITPEFIKVRIIKIDLPLKLGSEIVLEIKQFHIFKSKWKIQLTEFRLDSIITDTQVKGPFKVWAHSHCFRDENGKTLMTDKVSYELPLGIFGKAVNQIVLRRLIEKQFEFRHKKTKEILEKKF